MNPRLIAFYLPQFHAIPENDGWWGKGFTEWTNVSKARPLFRGHNQPNVPADLGFYDLRVPEARAAQAEMARQHGIEGFCYWHYWFNGRRLLERPFQEVLESQEPDFPFCLAWANESWTGVWNGEPKKILIEQTYPGEDDYIRHFQALLKAFGDERYITVNGKPLFIVYRPESLPDSHRFTDLWNSLALKAGLRGIYFVGIQDRPWSEVAGFDGYTYHLPGTYLQALPGRIRKQLVRKLEGSWIDRYIPGYSPRPLSVPYELLTRNALSSIRFGPRHFPSVLPNWDSTPRHGKNGLVVSGGSPQAFRRHLREAVDVVHDRDPDHRLVFLKSWNEWAEGNYLEPDLRFGKAYLEVVREEVSRVQEFAPQSLLDRMSETASADCAA